MCGITGWVSYDQDLRLKRGVIDAMTATMTARGPDASGTWVREHVSLGHRRLAIIDLDGGVQPMTIETPQGPVTIVYSGEAYNFTELRTELRARGARFRTESDTEVVLRGYLEWGDRVAERLNGMYAFAVWDEREQMLVMVRDRLGIKPFHYWRTHDGVIFGSEPKAILANPGVDRTVGLAGLRELFTMVTDSEPAVWDGMCQVPPGQVITVDRAGVRPRTYWTLAAAEHTDDRVATISRVRELLEDTIARQLVADVPRCTLLSGGLDSSALTAFAANLSEGRPRAYTVNFSQHGDSFEPDEWRGTPDAPFARQVARHLDVDSREIVLDARALAAPEVRKAVVCARDLPMGFGDVDSSLYLLFEAVRSHSTVALSGEGADEVFAGYRWFHDPQLLEADTFPWQAAMPSDVALRGEFLRPDMSRVLDLPTYVHDSYRTAIDSVPELTNENEPDAKLRRASYLNLTRLLRSLLDRKDRMSMAVGLEVRVPFCDHRLVELLYNVPHRIKAFDGREKSLLRAASAPWLPKSVLERKKSHYPMTVDTGYLSALQIQTRDLLESPGHPVFDILDQNRVIKSAQREPSTLTMPERLGLEQLLDFAVWFDLYKPQLRLG